MELNLAPPQSGNRYPEVPIAERWEQYLAHVARPGVLGGANPRTLKRYRAVRDKHLRHCTASGVTHWAQVDKRAVQEYATWLSSREYADASVYLEATLIKQVVKWLVEEQKALPESNRIRLRLLRSETSDTYCYSRGQVSAMLDLCKSTPRLAWLADVIVALATTGMRIGELSSLRWSDVDLAAGVITLADNRHSGRGKKVGALRMTKGRRSRRVDIHPRLRKVLLRLPHQQDGGYVFRALGGGRLDPDKALRALKRDVIGVLKDRFPTPTGEVGFEHAGIHSLRHFFVTEAFSGGATDGEVRDWVGHRDSRIVERYRHLRGRAAQQTMGRLDFFGDAKKTGAAEPQSAPSRSDAEKTEGGRREEQNNKIETAGPNGSDPQSPFHP